MKYGKFTTIGLVFIFMVGCASSSSSNDYSLYYRFPPSGSNGSNPSESSVPSRVNYTGTGGKGISLAILAPKAKGLTDTQNYLPLVAQGELVSNFSGYSAISVMDRENLDKVYGELLSPYYDDNDKAGLDLGYLTATDYVMTGNITKTATGYSLQMQIVKTAIRRASLDLLAKLGVELTPAAKTELAGAATANHVNAQTALAQGITAQKGGTEVAALTYYSRAASFDPSLLEAANRASVISTAITSGNIGENVRNDIQRRNEWLNTLIEATTFFKDHQPFEITYSPTLEQGRVDYDKGTVDLSFDMYLSCVSSDFKVIDTIRQGLRNNGNEKWYFDTWPFGGSGGFLGRKSDLPGNAILFSLDENYHSRKSFEIKAELKNQQGKIIGSITEGLKIRRDAFLGWQNSAEKVVFKAVNANDITDNLSIAITSVDGISAAEIEKRGYIRISPLDR